MDACGTSGARVIFVAGTTSQRCWVEVAQNDFGQRSITVHFIVALPSHLLATMPVADLPQDLIGCSGLYNSPDPLLRR